MNMTNIYTLCLFIILVVCDTDTISIPSSCIGLSDGYYYLKLLVADEYPIIYAKCHNEYVILDPSLDEDIQLYFNSFEMYHTSVAGPSNTYPVNWDAWFLPNTNKYLLSPTCDSCEIHHPRQLYNDQTVYMMTGSLFGCYWLYHNQHDYDHDFTTYDCYYHAETTLTEDKIQQQFGDFTRYPLTDFSAKNDWDHSGLCAFNVRAANILIPTKLDHESCTMNDIHNGYHLKPSIGTNGQHCICTQPITNININNMFQIDSIQLKHKQQQSKMDSIVMDDGIAQTIYLYAHDFEYGTYRIIQAGRYVLMEDILFNPNIESDWRPQAQQQDEYPGAASYRDAYFMGFWAAITVETSDVIIDLNDHSIAMDKVFYYQQRWFTIISLTSQYYLPGQGIGFFGATPKFASNVVIKDGVLGLTSHHCIHGNFNTHILIEHVICRDFETHGIQLNGFAHITIRNVEIGPSSNIAYLRGEYGHARAILPRLQKVADENPDKRIQFDGREAAVSMSELRQELVRQMELIFDYVYNDNEPEPVPSDWNDILQLFYNPSGLPNGASIYGIYLNRAGENVMCYNLNGDMDMFSSHVVLENIRMHDIRHDMIEYIRVARKTMNPYGSVYVNPLQAPYDATQMFFSVDKDDLENNNVRYKGTIMTDILFALSEFTENWDYLQNQLIFKDDTLPWAKGEKDGLNDVMIGCNNDVMLQSGKGLMGIRIDGVESVKLSNIEIYNLFEQSKLGLMDCGGYSQFDDGGHMWQKSPMQVGFSGNTLQGIVVNAADNLKLSEVNIYGLQSYTGDALGISVWPSVNLMINGEIHIDDIHSGWLIPEQYDELTWESRPNRAPMACGILYMNEMNAFDSIQTGVSSISVSHVYGFVYCDGSKDMKTMIGEYIGVVKSVNGGEDETDYSDDLQEQFGNSDKLNGDHVLVGTIIACSILFCGFVTMAYIVYIYCKHKKQQKDTEERAKLLLQHVQDESLLHVQQTQTQTQNVHLQSAKTDLLCDNDNNTINTCSNYQSFPFLSPNNVPNNSHNHNGIQEEDLDIEEQNERTPLIKQLPAFDRLNL